MVKICEICGEEFEPEIEESVCSEECAQAWVDMWINIDFLDDGYTEQ